VLAGGRSSRFGVDKLAVELRGVPLLHHAVRTLAEVCGEVVVVLAPEGVRPALPPGLPVRVARDAREGEGPLAGLAAGLGEVTTEWALVAAGDMPDLAHAVLLEMLRVAAAAPADAVVLREGEVWRPLPCVVAVAPARTNVHTLLYAGERSVRALIASLRSAVIDEATWRALDPSAGTLLDVDEPGDLPAG
jgi:molybdopterin-guanine dinucleotide biosynthesis protein A